MAESYIAFIRLKLHQYLLLNYVVATFLQVSAESIQASPISSQTCGDLCRFNKWVMFADCAELNLPTIPSACSRAVSLDMSNNNLAILPNNTFKNFNAAQYIYLQENGMTEIQDGAFVGLNEAVYLTLGGNCFKKLDVGTFHGLDKLLFLLVKGGCVETVTKGTFSNTTNMVELNLSRNRLRSPLCGAFSEKNNLRKLTLSDNFINVLPDFCFEELSEVEELNLSGNNLTDVPNRFALKGLRKLRVFSLDRTSLARVPAQIFDDTPNIQSLSLSYNMISFLANDSFLNLPNLTFLNLKGNAILTIYPLLFANNMQLQTLDISENQLASVDSGALDHLENLKQLHLSNNHLTSLSNITSVFGTIGELSLANNPLVCDCSIIVLRKWLNKKPNMANSSAGRATCNHSRSNKVINVTSEGLTPDLCPESLTERIPNESKEVHLPLSIQSTAPGFFAGSDNTYPAMSTTPPAVTSAFVAMQIDIITISIVIVLLFILVVSFTIFLKCIYKRVKENRQDPRVDNKRVSRTDTSYRPSSITSVSARSTTRRSECLPPPPDSVVLLGASSQDSSSSDDLGIYERVDIDGHSSNNQSHPEMASIPKSSCDQDDECCLLPRPHSKIDDVTPSCEDDDEVRVTIHPDVEDVSLLAEVETANDELDVDVHSRNSSVGSPIDHNPTTTSDEDTDGYVRNEFIRPVDHTYQSNIVPNSTTV